MTDDSTPPDLDDRDDDEEVGPHEYLGYIKQILAKAFSDLDEIEYVCVLRLPVCELATLVTNLEDPREVSHALMEAAVEAGGVKTFKTDITDDPKEVANRAATHIHDVLRKLNAADEEDPEE